MEHLSTIIVAVILGVIITAIIIIRDIKNRKSGKACACGGDCGSCGLCHSQDEQ